MSKRIAIFGGSFNPPHIGHIAICEWLFARDMVDEVWVVPCFVHPFGKELVPFKDRFKMCLFAFEKFGKKVKVSRIEEKLGGISHTIKTIKNIIDSYPAHQFFLITGDDVSNQTSEWRDFEEIKSLVKIIKVPRGNESPIPDISATEVRRRVSLGEPIVDFITRSVAVYIVTHNLYRS